MKQGKKDPNQNPNQQKDDNQQRNNTPSGGQQQTPGKAQENPQKLNFPRSTDVDEEDEEMDPRQRKPA